MGYVQATPGAGYHVGLTGPMDVWRSLAAKATAARTMATPVPTRNTPTTFSRMRWGSFGSQQPLFKPTVAPPPPIVGPAIAPPPPPPATAPLVATVTPWYRKVGQRGLSPILKPIIKPVVQAVIRSGATRPTPMPPVPDVGPAPRIDDGRAITAVTYQGPVATEQAVGLVQGDVMGKVLPLMGVGLLLWYFYGRKGAKGGKRRARRKH